MQTKIGDKVRYAEMDCTVTKILKNNRVNLQCWMQGGFMQHPELLKLSDVNLTLCEVAG